MLLVRIEYSCMGWPDGNIDYGHLDVKVQGQRQEEEAEQQIRSQLYLESEDRFADMEVIILDKRDDEFDRGRIYAQVVAGEGIAIGMHPVGKQLTRY